MSNYKRIAKQFNLYIKSISWVYDEICSDIEEAMNKINVNKSKLKIIINNIKWREIQRKRMISQKAEILSVHVERII
jgi:hypothetical protein